MSIEGSGKMKTYIHSLQRQMPVQPTVKKEDKPKQDFASVLSEAATLKISKHAAERMNERNIEISDEKWSAIHGKVDEARSLGITNALVVTNEAALVVSAKNNTVITALNNDEANNKVFSNINGTILMNES